MMDFSGIKELSIGGVKLRELSVNGVKVWQKSRLPAGYTELKYVRTNGDGYIDTGINCSHHDAGIGYYFRGSVSQYMTAYGNNYLWGCYLNGSRAGNPTLNTASNINRTYVIAGNVAAQIVVGQTGVLPEINEVFEYWAEVSSNHTENISARMKTAKKDISLTLTGEALNGTYNTAMPDGNVYLGWVNGLTTATKFNGTWEVFQMYDVATGEMLRDYVPALHNDGAVGLYDLVADALFISMENPFTAGPVVV